jgi:hypothetical protein
MLAMTGTNGNFRSVVLTPTPPDRLHLPPRKRLRNPQFEIRGAEIYGYGVREARGIVPRFRAEGRAWLE